jgi:hypothetical protein
MSKKLTKEMLVMNYGITFVSEDGLHIMKGPKKLSQNTIKSSGYVQVNLRDKPEFDATPKEQRNKHTGCYKFPVHRVVYAWFHGEIPEDMVIDHIDTNKANNAISNLQCITQDENMAKYSADLQNSLVKCDLTKPRSYYEEKLEAHRKAARRLRAQLRYYDANCEE